MNRRSFLKTLLTSTVTLFGLGGGTFFYAREVEPNLLSIHKETINSNKIPNSFNNFTIAQFSDTHIGFQYTLDQLQILVKTLNEQQPDMVVFTGDLVDAPNTYNWDERLINLLSDIKAPFGKFWIYGNHDHGGYGTDIVKEAMEKSGFTLLKNSNKRIEKDGDAFTIVGLDDVMLGNPDMKLAIKNTSADLFTVLLVHEPDYADVVKDYPIDVQLSGHSHGGQIQVPFVGYIYTPIYAEKYVEGKYNIGTLPLQLYVNRGIGTTRLPYRLLCKPEITIIKFSKE